MKTLLHQRLSDGVVIKLIEQFVDYSVESGGEIYTPLSGISRGCALSPLIGAALLHHIDSYFAASDEVFYVRYMDDFLLLSPTRWGLRRAIARMQTFFNQSGFTCHPDKTQLGRREKGFDWLGIWFAPDGPTIAPRALQNHRDRCVRLYEQARLRGPSDQDASKRVQAYRTRWDNWANSFLKRMVDSAENQV